LRPGPECLKSDQTVESFSSGWAITQAVRSRLRESQPADDKQAADLVSRCGGRVDELNTRIVAQAAAAGNSLAKEMLDNACRVYGWAIAQMITLLSPNAVVLGGGVSLIGEELWIRPLRAYVRQYVFPPLADTYEIVPARLGEEMVVHGVLALAAEWR
jgi:glucokinase